MIDENLTPSIPDSSENLSTNVWLEQQFSEQMEALKQALAGNENAEKRMKVVEQVAEAIKAVAERDSIRDSIPLLNLQQELMKKLMEKPDPIMSQFLLDITNSALAAVNGDLQPFGQLLTTFAEQSQTPENKLNNIIQQIRSSQLTDSVVNDFERELDSLKTIEEKLSLAEYYQAIVKQIDKIERILENENNEIREKFLNEYHKYIFDDLRSKFARHSFAPFGKRISYVVTFDGLIKLGGRDWGIGDAEDFPQLFKEHLSSFFSNDLLNELSIEAKVGLSEAVEVTLSLPIPEKPQFAKDKEAAENFFEGYFPVSKNVLSNSVIGRASDDSNPDLNIGYLGKRVDGRDSISRKHAKVIKDESGWSIEDMGSANGTYINGVKIFSPTRIENGNVVRFGNFVEAKVRINKDGTLDMGFKKLT